MFKVGDYVFDGKNNEREKTTFYFRQLYAYQQNTVESLPGAIIQEDSNLLMHYDISLGRV